MAVAKKQIRQIISENNISSVADLYALLKDSFKDILIITVGANETSKFWLGMLNDLKNRGVKDVFSSVWTGFQALKKPSRQFIHRLKSRDVSSICCAIPLSM